MAQASYLHGEDSAEEYENSVQASVAVLASDLSEPEPILEWINHLNRNSLTGYLTWTVPEKVRPK
jgi:hypothetical protein